MNIYNEQVPSQKLQSPLTKDYIHILYIHIYIYITVFKTLYIYIYMHAYMPLLFILPILTLDMCLLESLGDLGCQADLPAPAGTPNCTPRPPGPPVKLDPKNSIGEAPKP